MMEDRTALVAAILSAGKSAMVHAEQAAAMADRMLAGPASREAFIEAVVAEDPVRWIPLGTAERMADVALRLLSERHPSAPRL